MKKVLAVVLCLAVCFILSACINNAVSDSRVEILAGQKIALAACDSNIHSSSAEESLAPSSSAAEPSSVPEAAATPEPESTPEQEPSVGTDVEAEIQGFIDTYVAAQIDAMSETLQESGMSIDIFARGNSLVYSFQYHVDVGNTKLVKEGLEAELDSTASIYEEVLSTMKTIIPEAESIVIEYLDMDSNVIVSKEFAESE